MTQALAGFMLAADANGTARVDWLGRSARLFVGIVWLSSAIFAIYILAFFLGAVAAGTPDDWNQSLPRLHDPRGPLANLGIGVHFGLGAILLLLGPVQLLTGFRTRSPRWHRRIGWLYAPAAILTGLGGLAFIAFRGTIGGPLMDIAFGLYGALMVLAAVQAVRHAVARRLEVHRAWAIRLYALAIGSWLYRMDYGFWMALFGKAARTPAFDGPFDQIMLFWFYVPNLIVAEWFIRARRLPVGAPSRAAAATGLVVASLFVGLATAFFTAAFWGPVTLWRLGLGAG
jgi:hypothetical protein